MLNYFKTLSSDKTLKGDKMLKSDTMLNSDKMLNGDKMLNEGDINIIKMSTEAVTPPPSNKHYRSQVLAALAVSLGPFAAGLGKGYTSPAIDSLQGNGSSGALASQGAGLIITDQEASWIASLSLLGALFGGALGGAAMRQGRRKALLIISLPLSMCWLLTMCADSVKMLLVTSLIAGFLCAIVSMVSQVYISEIAGSDVRGCLSSLLKILNQTGILISFSAGAYLDWQQLALVVACAPIALFLSIIYLPETPSFLLLRGKDEEAAKSLQWLRGPGADVRQELATIRTNILASKRISDTRQYFSKSIFSSRLTGPVLITCGLMLFQRFSGAHAFSFYAVSIFRRTFGGMSPHSGAISMSAVQILASCLSGLLIDTVGRLPLLISSGVLMSLSLASFGSYIYYEEVYRHTLTVASTSIHGEYDWVPLTCVLIFTVAFSLGISPISWLLIGELFPLEFRSLGSALATTFSYLCAFVSVKTFVDFQEALGLYGAFWLYAGVSLCGLCFVIIFVPETKGKEMDEMDPKYIESICINR